MYVEVQTCKHVSGTVSSVSRVLSRVVEPRNGCILLSPCGRPTGTFLFKRIIISLMLFFTVHRYKCNNYAKVGFHGAPLISARVIITIRLVFMEHRSCGLVINHCEILTLISNFKSNETIN